LGFRIRWVVAAVVTRVALALDAELSRHVHAARSTSSLCGKLPWPYYEPFQRRFGSIEPDAGNAPFLRRIRGARPSEDRRRR
jgi:hypothetical protein